MSKYEKSIDIRKMGGNLEVFRGFTQMCASFPCFELTTDLTHLARGKEFGRLPRFRRLPWPAQARPAADGVVAMVSETLAACADLPENPRQGNRLLLRPGNRHQCAP